MSLPYILSPHSRFNGDEDISQNHNAQKIRIILLLQMHVKKHNSVLYFMLVHTPNSFKFELHLRTNAANIAQTMQHARKIQIAMPLCYVTPCENLLLHKGIHFHAIWKHDKCYFCCSSKKKKFTNIILCRNVTATL